MREILQKHLQRMYADEQLPKTVLNEGRTLVAQGKYEAALEKYLWFHRHSLEYNQGFGGVRLSFALKEWVELGERFPPARQALLAVREESTTAIENGQGTASLFHDVTAINRYLQDSAHTIQLFHRMHQRHPDLARECYEIAEPFLVEGGEFAVCSSYLPDPEKRLEEVRQLFQMTLEIATENPVLSRPEARLTNYARLRLVETTNRLIAILEGVGRTEEADRVRAFVREQETR